MCSRTLEKGPKKVRKSTGRPFELCQSDVLTGDYHFTVDQHWSSPYGVCTASGLQSASVILVPPAPDSPVNWTNAVHGRTGHLALVDNSVHLTTKAAMWELFATGGYDPHIVAGVNPPKPVMHLLMPP